MRFIKKLAVIFLQARMKRMQHCAHILRDIQAKRACV